MYLQGPTLCLFHDFGMYLRQIIMYLRQTVYTMITSTFGPVSVTISDFQGRSANLKWNQKVVFLGMFISCSDQFFLSFMHVPKLYLEIIIDIMV